MSDDQNNILLGVKVDTSDVARGVAEVKAGMAEMNAAAAAGMPMAGTSGATLQQAAALEELAAREAACVDPLEQMDENQKRAHLSAREMHGALMALQNPLHFLVMSANEGSAALTRLFMGPGAQVAGIFVMFELAKSQIERVRQAFAELENYWNRVRQLQQEAQSAAFGRVEDTATKLARAGLVSKEAVASAGQIRSGLLERGASAEGADAVLNLAVGPNGERTMTDDQMLQAAAFAEFRPDKIPKVEKPADVKRAREILLRRLSSNTDLGLYLQALDNRVGRQDIARQGQNGEAIRRTLELQGEKIDDNDLKDILAIANQGFVRDVGASDVIIGAGRQLISQRQNRGGDAGSSGWSHQPGAGRQVQQDFAGRNGDS